MKNEIENMIIDTGLFVQERKNKDIEYPLGVDAVFIESCGFEEMSVMN